MILNRVSDVIFHIRGPFLILDKNSQVEVNVMCQRRKRLLGFIFLLFPISD